MWGELGLLIGTILSGGIILIAIARYARRANERLGLRPVRRHKSWFMDSWLHDKAIRSQREFWFGPLPILWSSLGRTLAIMTIVAVLALLLGLVVFVLWHQR